jgi:hypothetical protein
MAMSAMIKMAMNIMIKMAMELVINVVMMVKITEGLRTFKSLNKQMCCKICGPLVVVLFVFHSF